VTLVTFLCFKKLRVYARTAPKKKHAKFNVRIGKRFEAIHGQQYIDVIVIVTSQARGSADL